MIRLLLRIAGAAMACVVALSPASAQGYDENPSGRPIYLLGDLRVVAADGERSWLDGGLGKGRFGGAADRDLRLRPPAIEGDAVWQPQPSFAIGATIAAARLPNRPVRSAIRAIRRARLSSKGRGRGIEATRIGPRAATHKLEPAPTAMDRAGLRDRGYDLFRRSRRSDERSTLAHAGRHPPSPSPGSKSSEAELMQKRRPSGPGPSGKTWPRWPSHWAQRTSVRTMP